MADRRTYSSHRNGGDDGGNRHSQTRGGSAAGRRHAKQRPESRSRSSEPATRTRDSAARSDSSRRGASTRAASRQAPSASSPRASRQGSGASAGSRAGRATTASASTRRSGGASRPVGGGFLSKSWLRFYGIIAGVLAVVLVGALGIPAIGRMIEASKPAYEAADISLVAVGDNLPDEFVGYYADGLAGEMDDGHYDYSPIYEPLKPCIQGADLAYVNQETHIGGMDPGPAGYPSFNTTDEMADAIVDAGFDFVASATNHSYDWGLHGALDHSVALWETKPVAFTGTATTKEQYDRIVTQERDGITFALLNYTYGVNGFERSDLPPYAVNFIDEKRIAADVGRAHFKADVVIVAMHWGTELLMEADEEQQRLAQFLADLNVDVVLGSHPHVIGPMAWVPSSIHPDHRTLVAYSLGNFLADHETPTPESALEGMLSCNFHRDQDGSITIQDVKWTPLICHANEERSGFAVYAVDDYTADLARQNRSLASLDDPIAWLNAKSREVVGADWF